MRARNILSNLVTLGIIAAAGYLFMKWSPVGGSADDNSAFAEKSCVDEIRSRYDTTTARSNSVRANENGYVVRGTMTLARGNVAKVTCLTNRNGAVTEVIVEER
jgi:hypothetical protein